MRPPHWEYGGRSGVVLLDSVSRTKARVCLMCSGNPASFGVLAHHVVRLPSGNVHEVISSSYSAWDYGGAVAGGSHGPVVKSWRSASSLLMPHLAAVDR
jgi:hypothetical protein